MESCPERGRAVAIRCRNTLLNIPELWVSEAFQNFLSGDAVLGIELFTIYPYSEIRVQKNSQGAYGRASEELAN
jgi:hypothetical protein